MNTQCILVGVFATPIKYNINFLLYITVAVYENVRVKIKEFNNNYKTIKMKLSKILENKKYFLYALLALVFAFSMLSGCSEVKHAFADTHQLVTEMTKIDLIWIVLIMSFIGSSAGS